jgi:hypothetical protein
MFYQQSEKDFIRTVSNTFPLKKTRVGFPKKQKHLEVQGIDPRTSRMLSERSTI